MTSLPNAKFEIIDDANQADSYQYVIIGKSRIGRYINAGFSITGWNIALDSYLHIANEWLKLVDDTLESVLMTSSDNINDPTYIDALNKGVSVADVIRRSKQPLQPSIDSPVKAWSIHGEGGRIVETIEQLTDNAHPLYHPMNDHLITVFTDRGQDAIYACRGFSKRNLDSVHKQTTAEYCTKYQDQIKLIVLSKKDNKHYNAHHLAIIDELLKTRQRFDSTHIQRMIGKTPPPPNTPSPVAHTSPTQPPSNDAIHAQAGNAHLSVLALIGVIILLCLPFQCAMAYTKDLSKSNSDWPSRELLAFFVPNICNAPQAIQMDSTTVLNPSQGKTVYDGLTLQNKRALGQICRAVSVRTESKTRHPIPIVLSTVDSVALTQNLTGGSHHG